MSGSGRTVHGYTSDQIIAAIGTALDAHDMPAVVSLLSMLAVVNPGAAQALLLAIEVAKDGDLP
jgi:hypothetical protein